MNTKTFFCTWTFGEAKGVFKTEAKTSRRAVSRLLEKLSADGIVVTPMDYYKVDVVVEEKL